MSYWTCSHAIALHLIGIHFLWCMWFFMKFICRAIIVDIVIFTKCLAEADDGPFPWDVTKQAKPKFDITPTEKSCSPAQSKKCVQFHGKAMSVGLWMILALHQWWMKLKSMKAFRFGCRLGQPLLVLFYNTVSRWSMPSMKVMLQWLIKLDSVTMSFTGGQITGMATCGRKTSGKKWLSFSSRKSHGALLCSKLPS